LNFKLLFVCINNHFNNLYGSGSYIFLLPHSDAISGSINAAAGIAFFKNLGQIYNKMDRVGLLGRRLGARLEKRRPPYGNPPRHPQNGPKNTLRLSLFGEGRASGDALRS
jgi:hypothetical protein